MEENYYLALLHKIGINHKKLHYIFKDDINYKVFYDKLSFKKLNSIGYTDKQIENILKEKSNNDIHKLIEKLEERNVLIITIKDKNFPDYLKQIPNIPYLFYLRGKIDNKPKISVVGSRMITSYGEKAIKKIIGEISNYFTIVSGGAAGCDSRAHEVAIENGNNTICVIGTGIDIDYPAYNKKLFDSIVSSGGGIVSIFPVGEKGNTYNFPIRNEIVAGLSVGVIVVEAKNKSGSLITSYLALDMGKDLFAIPGDYYKETSEGCNMLIKTGVAKLITCSEDVLIEYNISNKSINNNSKKNNFDDSLEENIYNMLILDSLTIDQISIKLGLNVTNISLKLSMLEIKNLIKKVYGGKYEIN